MLHDPDRVVNRRRGHDRFGEVAHGAYLGAGLCQCGADPLARLVERRRGRLLGRAAELVTGIRPATRRTQTPRRSSCEPTSSPGNDAPPPRARDPRGSVLVRLRAVRRPVPDLRC